MRSYSYRSSPLKLQSEGKSRQKSARAKLNQSASHKSSNLSPLRAATSRTSSKEKQQERKNPKSRTEEKVESIASSLRKLSYSSKRYRLIPSKGAKTGFNNEWEGVSAKKIANQLNILEQQKRSLAKLQQIRNSMNEQKTAHIKYRSKQRQDRSKVTKIANKLKPIPLKSYIQFICGADVEFNIGFDFSYIKALTRTQARTAIDFSAFSLLESIQLCALDILTQPANSNSQKLLREYSLLYFRQFEKNMMEVVLAHHYFKMAQASLHLFFVYTRYFFLILHELSIDEVYLQHAELLKRIFQDILQTQKIIYQGKSDIDKQSNSISETLKNLKITSEVEKKTVEFVGKVKHLLKNIGDQERLKNMLRQFEPLELQTGLQGLELQFLTQTEVAIGWTYLGIPPIPFLPATSRRYTLVLSVESMLIHYDLEKKMLMYRPYLDQFLAKMASEVELIAFSSQIKARADQFIDCIEKSNRYFSYRLYKEHLSLKNGSLVKDLSRLGRQNERVLMVDTIAVAPGVWRIPQFRGSGEDKILIKLENELIYSLRGSPEDISKLGGYFGSLEHIQEQFQEQNTISSNQ